MLVTCKLLVLIFVNKQFVIVELSDKRLLLIRFNILAFVLDKVVIVVLLLINVTGTFKLFIVLEDMIQFSNVPVLEILNVAELKFVDVRLLAVPLLKKIDPDDIFDELIDDKIDNPIIFKLPAVKLVITEFVIVVLDVIIFDILEKLLIRLDVLVNGVTICPIRFIVLEFNELVDILINCAFTALREVNVILPLIVILPTVIFPLILTLPPTYNCL